MELYQKIRVDDEVFRVYVGVDDLTGRPRYRGLYGNTAASTDKAEDTIARVFMAETARRGERRDG